MKTRFGDSNLHACDVMIKDIKDSEKINGNIKKSINEHGGKVGSKILPLQNFNVCIISQGFWESI